MYGLRTRNKQHASPTRHVTDKAVGRKAPRALGSQTPPQPKYNTEGKGGRDTKDCTSEVSTHDDANATTLDGCAAVSGETKCHVTLFVFDHFDITNGEHKHVTPEMVRLMGVVAWILTIEFPKLYNA